APPEKNTPDGPAPRLAPDAAIIANEPAKPRPVVPRLVQTAGERAVMAELPGIGAVISPSGKKVAYLKLPQNEEIKRALASLNRAGEQSASRNAAQQTLNYLQWKYAVVTLRDLRTRQETELRTGALLKSSLPFGLAF